MGKNKISMFIVVFLVCIAPFSLLARWDHPEWRCRKPIIIYNYENDSILIDYALKIEIQGNKQLKSDFSDLRFTDSNGVALSCWIEEWVAGERSTVWVKLPLIRAHDATTIYMYYGNLRAQNISNGKRTFYFFDDFNDCDISDWTIISGNWHEHNAFLEQTVYAIRRKILSMYSITKPVIINAKLKHITGDPVCGVHIILSKFSNCNNGYYFGYAGINRGGTMISRIIEGNVVQLVTDSTIQTTGSARWKEGTLECS
jgi:hypothetical protein